MIFNDDLYTIKFDSNKDKALREIYCKVNIGDEIVEEIYGCLIDCAYIAGLSDDLNDEFLEQSKQGVYDFYNDMGMSEEFQRDVKEGTNKALEFFNEAEYEEFCENQYISESDLFDYLDKKKLMQFSDDIEFESKDKYLLLFKPIENGLIGDEVLNRLKENIEMICSVTLKKTFVTK